MRFLLSVPLLLCILVIHAQAEDVIRLNNGDTLRGKILQVGRDKIEFESSSLGKLELDRKKVAAIVFDAFQPAPAAGKTAPAGNKPAAPEQGGDPDESVQKLIRDLAPEKFGPRELKELERGAKRNKTPEDVVKQLRTEGIAPGTVESIQAGIPGLATPEVQDYFNDRVDGLKSGDVDISDIRKDAQDAVTQLEDLQKDLGPDGAALNGYLSILKGFIEKTKPTAPKAKPIQPKGVLPAK